MAELVAGPGAEPLTRAQAKEFLRIDHDEEDTLVEALVTAARRWVEARTGRALMTQTWRFARDDWPVGGIILAPIAPVRRIVEARVRGVNGAELAVPDGVLRTGSGGGGLILVDRARAPRPSGPEAIAITVEAGYGAAVDVPADLVQAVRLMMAHFYTHRDEVGNSARIPEAMTALLGPYRLVRL